MSTKPGNSRRRDWLAGLTDDPRPAAELAARYAGLERRLAAGAQQQ